MFFYKYIFNAFLVFLLFTTTVHIFFAMPNVETARQKKVKKASFNHDVKFKKIFCSKKTKKNSTKEEDHADDECHEEEENEPEKEQEEREETECEEVELEEQEKKDDEENDDHENNKENKEKTLNDIKTILLSLCVTDEERHLVKNLNYDQAKSLLKILQKN